MKEIERLTVLFSSGFFVSGLPGLMQRTTAVEHVPLLPYNDNEPLFSAFRSDSIIET